VPLVVEAIQKRGDLHHVDFCMDAADRCCAPEHEAR
jgi:hypothetical protein